MRDGGVMSELQSVAGELGAMENGSEEGKIHFCAGGFNM